MPLTPRRRHHSWPFSNRSTKALERNISIDVRSSRLASRVRGRHIAFGSVLEEHFRQGDVYEEDDAVSAGIITSKGSRHTRLWRSSTGDTSDGRGQSENGERDVITSTVTEADELPTAILRRIIWPRWERARLLFPHMTTTTSTDNVIISCRSSPNLSIGDTETISEPHRRDTELNEGYLRPLAERRHRRCHSEQPRVWKEPSPDLWTLMEE